MSEILKNHIRKFVNLSEEEFAAVLSFFRTAEVAKKENLLTEGQICGSNYFVLKGCLRKFFINDKGIEQTTEFAIENWWITDHISFEHQTKSEFYIQAVEPSIILMIDRDSQERLLELHPKMERYFRFIYQRAYAAAQMRIKYLFDLSKEESYHAFYSKYPEFVQRIPQYLLASFLGFTPEYLSELRKKKRS
ncbi:Crp/Fnr family transcriptional regulator [Adhaeribacter sp. BT258]|uniref:Crp/Fnr family transcriptional regulator n=1 Tax=Adhaeribacter terrigena TaxID=2793070 RepID=A0ABS1C3I3_9BACT|nr:Crp/Fnr family transcriptional regulator [Adhaeribacter terrigena]MBK0403905.1 Crp/Fnr family transcriptional regulator [Adhaeribacter terrigena]